jgi:hypothetical protein
MAKLSAVITIWVVTFTLGPWFDSLNHLDGMFYMALYLAGIVGTLLVVGRPETIDFFD